MTKEEQNKAINRINQIDSMFKNSSGWQPWMEAASHERKCLVEDLKSINVLMEHKHELELNWKEN